MITQDQQQSRYTSHVRHVWPWPSVLLEEMGKWVGALPGDLWLDAACGNGQLGKVLADVSQKNLIGLDLDPQRLNLAKLESYETLIRGSVTSVPLKHESVHGIASIETLEHISDLEAVLGEFARCLQKNGYLLLSVPSVTLRSWWEMFRTRHPVYCDSNEHVREFSAVSIKGFPHMFETWGKLESRLSDHGFTVLRREGVGFLFPMWTGEMAWLESGVNILYRERLNQWIGRIPVLRNFPYYLIYVLQYHG